MAAPLRTVAILTARGGSKGLPRKNVLPLAGKPLIAHTVEAALGCPLIAGVWVSTDDAEIAAAARLAGAGVIDRPAELALDTSTSSDAVAHAIGALRQEGHDFSHFALLQPTSPLRTAAHLTECLEQFAAGDFASAISVCESEHHPQKMLKLADDGRLVPFSEAADLQRRRQDLPAVYRQNGAIYVMAVEDFLTRAEGFYLEPAMAYVMSHRDSIDIDTATDLLVAEALLAR